ncbi:MAG: YcxB family protein [Anaerolineae bacterium]|nr:YcxB family protein [Anaerolineae bacterium]
MWEQNEVLRVHKEGSITPETLEIRTLQGQWRLLWTDLTGYGEYRDVVVLFMGPGAPIPFPRQFFRSQEEWDVFRAMVAENLELSHRVTSIEKSRILLFTIILVAILALVAKTITES